MFVMNKLSTTKWFKRKYDPSIVWHCYQISLGLKSHPNKMSDDGRQSDSGTGAISLNATPNSENKASAETATTDTNTSSQIAKGLSYTISTLITDFDTQAQHTSRSQHQLSSAIHRLTRELDQLLADAPSPFIMQHAAKISGVRKRVASLNSVLKSIQRRLDNIDGLVSAGLPNGNDVKSLDT